MNKQKDYLKFLKMEQIGLLLSLIALCIFFSLTTTTFLSQLNFMNVLRQTSFVAICGIGVAMIILLGEIDLSVGSSQALVGIITVVIANRTNVYVGVLAGITAGGLIGLCNGLLVTKCKMNSLIVTLGTMSIIRGISMVSTNASSIQVKCDGFKFLGAGYIFYVPVPVIITIILFICAYLFLNHTAFGREVYAVGGNKDAAKLAGLPVDAIKVKIYVVGGMLTGLSAVILASRLNSGQPNAGSGFEMQVIAAIILGGISLTGGIGTLSGAFIGMLILGVLSDGLTLLQVNSFWQDISRGAVIILAVYLDLKRKSKNEQKILAKSINVASVTDGTP